MRSFTPNFIKEWIKLIRTAGFKGFVREKGWKVLVVFVLFYLIRDLIIYLLIPYLIINNIVQCQ